MENGGRVGRLYVEIAADDSPLRKSLSAAGRSMEELEAQIQSSQRATVENLSKLGNKLTLGLTVPLAAGAAAALNYASDLEETLSKVDVVFGGNADSIKDWASTAVEQMGLAEETALSAAATYGNMADGMGLTADQGAEMAKSLTRLSADLASFNNTSQETAQIALNSIFTGETETLKQYGIVMTEANLEQFAMQQGLSKTVSEMNQAEKVQLRYNYVLANTANAQGDFARTSDSVANQTRMAKEQLKQAAAALGQNLVPAAASALKVLNNILSGFQELNPAQQKMILGIAGIAAAAGPAIKLGTGAYSMVQKLDKALTGLQMSKIAKEVNKFGESTTAASKGLDLIVHGAQKADGSLYTVQEIISHNTAELKKFGIEGDQAAKVLQATATTSAATGAGISGVGTASAAAQPAVKSFGLTLNSALGIVGMAVSAVSLLVGVFNGLGKETSASAKQIEADTDAIVSSMEEVTESAAGLRTEYDESIAKVDSMAEEAGKLVDEYYSLADGADKSEDSQKRMKEIVQSLSGRFDSLSGYIDENTGLLNANRETVLKSIDAQLAYNRALANRDYRIETTKAYTEAEAKQAAAEKMLADNQKEIDRIRKGIEKTETRLLEIDGQKVAIQGEVNDGNVDAVKQYQKLNAEEKELTETHSDLIAQYDELNQGQKEIREGSDDLTDAIKKLSAEREAAAEMEKMYFEQSAASFEEQIKQADSAGEAYQSFSETQITAMKDILASGIELDDATREHFVNAIQMNEEEVAAIEEGSSRITAAKAKELEARKLAGEELTQIEQAQLDRYKEIQDNYLEIATNAFDKVTFTSGLTLKKIAETLQHNQEQLAKFDENMAYLQSINDRQLQTYLANVDVTDDRIKGALILMGQDIKDHGGKITGYTKQIIEDTVNVVERGADETTSAVRDGASGSLEGISEEWSAENAQRATNSFFGEIENSVNGKAVALKSQVKYAMKHALEGAQEEVDLGGWEAIGGEMIDRIRSAVKGAAGSLNDAISSVVQTALNKAKSKMSSFSAGISIKGTASSVRLQGYDVGGYFTTPQVIQIAEKRPEFVGAAADLETFISKSVGEAFDRVNPVIFREVGTEVPYNSNKFGSVTVNVPVTIQATQKLSRAEIQKSAKDITEIVGREMARSLGGKVG